MPVVVILFMFSPQSFPPEFRNWTEVVPSFAYNKTLPFFQMLVPTIDTVR